MRMNDEKYPSAFPSEISRNFAPAPGFPFEQGDVCIGIVLQPGLGACDEAEELFRARRPGQFGATLLAFHPKHGVTAVGVDCEINALLLEQGEGMNNGEKLSDIVRPVNGTEMKYLLSRFEIDATIFHLSWISRTGGINGERVDGDFRR